MNGPQGEHPPIPPSFTPAYDHRAYLWGGTMPEEPRRRQPYVDSDPAVTPRPSVPCPDCSPLMGQLMRLNDLSRVNNERLVAEVASLRLEVERLTRRLEPRGAA